MSGYNPKLSKDKMDVIIRTDQHKIEGSIHKFQNTRLLDMLNKSQGSFIPVSDAHIYSLDTGKLIFESSFLALNMSKIVLIAESYTLPGHN